MDTAMRARTESKGNSPEIHRGNCRHRRVDATGNGLWSSDLASNHRMNVAAKWRVVATCSYVCELVIREHIIVLLSGHDTA